MIALFFELEDVLRRMNMKKTRGKTDRKIIAGEIKNAFLHNRKYSLAKDIYTATPYDNYQSLALAVRDRMIEKWILTQQRYHDENCKRVYYFSLEFLPGRFLEENILNLDLQDACRDAVESLGLNVDDIYNEEPDPGLGNGGLGRLAACFQESMATVGVAGAGYGIRYDYGIFKQKIKNGYQVEMPDEWLRLGNPWEFKRPEYTVRIKMYGKTIKKTDRSGALRVDWVDTRDMFATAFDTPQAGYQNDVVNNLRLWSATSTEDFDLEYFNGGDYIGACKNKIDSENVSRVLYPSDDIYEGLELRLKQEYFFTSASIQDIIRRFKRHNKDFLIFPDKVAIQINDTHPAVAIAELMRIMIDEENIDWDMAWEITVKTFGFTNHTIMPEALEKWPVSLFGKLLPRHLEIIYEINDRFLKCAALRKSQDPDILSRISLIEEGKDQKVRMSHLAICGSHSVNGVSRLHTELLKTTLFKDFFEIFPDKFNAKTNGITPRRWLKKANAPLAELIDETIGREWIKDLTQLKKLTPFASNAVFGKKWQKVKRVNKLSFAEFIKLSTGIRINPDSMFDVHVKRVHEYKRQILFMLYLISEYLKIKNNSAKDTVPRTAIIAGKAAPGYRQAKLTIKFINSVAEKINKDPDMKDKLKVVFLENYGVSLAEEIFPASDLSEQLSTAGKEASGTGNMKFMLNGALTIGTWDGANIEIAEEVGPENIFIFGLRAEKIAEFADRGSDGSQYMRQNAVLSEIVSLIKNNFFSQDEPDIFKPLYETLLARDPYMVFADFENYLSVQDKVGELYKNTKKWTTKSILNTANAGKFSSDRMVREYAKEIWGINT